MQPPLHSYSRIQTALLLNLLHIFYKEIAPNVIKWQFYTKVNDEIHFHKWILKIKMLSSTRPRLWKSHLWAACTPKDYLILDADDEWLCGKDAGTAGWREASEVHPPLSAPPRAPASRARSITVQWGQPVAAPALQEPARRSPGSAEVIVCPLVGGGRKSGALTSSCQVAEQGSLDREVEEQHCGCAWSGPLQSGEHLALGRTLNDGRLAAAAGLARHGGR